MLYHEQKDIEKTTDGEKNADLIGESLNKLSEGFSETVQLESDAT
jgi:hypothetical protein